jgi:hypothetical protein
MLPERRRDKRTKTIHEKTECFSDPLLKDKITEGFVANISESGICLVIINPLNKGQTITINNNNVVHPINAIVRWIKDCKGLYYKVGLEFVKP